MSITSFSHILDRYKVSRETLLKFEQFIELLYKWNKTINLVKITNNSELWHRHILDSIQLIDYINSDQTIIDLGSGGGFPGIILSIIGIKKTILVEADTRKCMFLHQAAQISNNSIIIKNQRIEDNELPKTDIITSRALCSIDKFCSFVARININAKIILLKGALTHNEIELAKHNWVFDYKLHSSITATNSYIVEIFNLKNKNL